jgi:hypothetical protein
MFFQQELWKEDSFSFCVFSARIFEFLSSHFFGKELCKGVLPFSFHGKSTKSRCFEILRLYLFVRSTILCLASTMSFLAMKII